MLVGHLFVAGSTLDVISWETQRFAGVTCTTFGRAGTNLGRDGLRVCCAGETSLGGVPREQKMLEGHLPRVIYHQVY